MTVRLTTIALILLATATYADPLKCDLANYKASPGLMAAVSDNTLAVTWDGDNGQTVRLTLTINGGSPTISDLAVKRKGGSWVTVASHVTPEFRVVSGYRRMEHQQIGALQGLGVTITPQIVDKYKWDAFWDAPLHLPGDESAHGGSTPPREGIANQPGLPRKPEEVKRATAVYHAQGCDVQSNGARLEVSFPGVEMGVFAGRLQYTVYQGTNLVRQELIAKTEETSVAYKYDAGLKGLTIQPTSKVVWRDTSNLWQDYQLDSAINHEPATLWASNRVVAVEGPGGAIAAFPPPHNFFWTREILVNLGYNWYRKDSASSFAFGVREAETEEDPAYTGRGSEDRRQNFALRNARPGTWQRMPVYFYVGDQGGEAAIQSALAFTRGDHFKPLAGYMVMATHFHTSMVGRLKDSGSLDNVLPDLELAKGAGVNIFAPVDGGNSAIGAAVPRDAEAIAALIRTLLANHVQNLADYYEAARLHSGKTFLVMPNEEIALGDLGKQLGGHNDLLVSHPVFWLQGRTAEQPLVENDPKYGKVYHIGSPADLLDMAHREDLIIYMPHPRTKGSAGYPDAIKDQPHFRDENYRGVGFRWGMGVDGSEQRLCDFRCMPLFDDMNNWVADLPTPPKYMHAITETYQQGPGDDFYANNPVNYVKVDGQPGIDNWKPIVDAMKRGDYFVTSGEVLIPSYAVQGTGNQRTIVADVEWTFPLEFAEVVWGDGQKTDRQIIPVTDLPVFGKHHFQIPFDTTGKKWVRFAVWDSAGNGAFVQPVKLHREPGTASR